MYEPGYKNLASSGELMRRATLLKKQLRECTICPHQCRTDRNDSDTGFCRSFSKPYICSYGPHHGEEPPLSGFRGSGTIFMGRCNLRCVYCQNADISQELDYPQGYLSSSDDLARIMINLQDLHGCHNINFVSPTHFVPQILEAIAFADAMGLNIPLVYNTNSYDSLETLKLLDGVIDIYLPDLKYHDDQIAFKYSGISNYVTAARNAVREMYRQVGPLVVDQKGIAKRGLLIRHLVLPDKIAGSSETIKWIASALSNKVTVNLMDQYHPAFRASLYPELMNRPSRQEFMEIVNEMRDLGFNNSLLQNRWI